MSISLIKYLIKDLYRDCEEVKKIIDCEHEHMGTHIFCPGTSYEEKGIACPDCGFGWGPSCEMDQTTAMASYVKTHRIILADLLSDLKSLEEEELANGK